MHFEARVAPVEIVKIGHPVLRHGTRMVSQELFDKPALHELIEVMRATLAGKGVGLAAPQIAVPLRLSVIEDTEDRMMHYKRYGILVLKTDGYGPLIELGIWSLSADSHFGP